ncbi:MAG: PDZ domain-containing protein [Planctomycetales bacterium]
MIRHPKSFAGIAALLLGLAAAIPAHAQPRERLAKSEAPLVVDGVVRQLFRSSRQGRADYLFQIEVLRSEGRKPTTGGVRSRFPGPGESMYVHVSQRLDQSGRPVPAESHKDLPGERAQVRIYLTPREQGGWEGAFPDWFDMTGDQPSEASPDDPESGVAEKLPIETRKSRLGMTTESLKSQNRLALRVTSIERGGLANKCGLEVGDIIAGVDGAALVDADQLEMLAFKGKKFTLVVVDVNTGRGAQVEIDPTQQPGVGGETGAPSTAPPQPARVSLGISAEPVTLGSRSALKITRVDPAGPAAKAGIEQGDIVVAANGAPITGPEQLLGALRKSGATLKLTVRDSRTGRDTEVAVILGVTRSPAPADVEAPVGVTAGKLGAVTELAFHEDDFAVKVTEVETGSAAARAGMRPGVMILAANGKPVLHPNELNDAVRKSGSTLKLTVVDPTTGKKSNLDVNLGK